MKKFICILSVVAICSVSAMADYTVWSGATYDATISDPVVVGVTPSGGDLVSFTLTFTNTTGLAGADPYNIDVGDGETGRGITGNLHQQEVGSPFDLSSPTLDEAALADGLDSHFNVFNADLLSLVDPVEDAFVLASAMPPSGAYFGFESYSFGSFLKGLFNASASRSGPSRTADWDIAQLVVPAEDLLLGAATPVHVNGGMSGSSLIEYFDFDIVIPEPATMSLLAVGGIAALIRRRK